MTLRSRAGLHTLALFVITACCWVAPGGAQIRPPNPEAQRAAMEKLGFLVGSWKGESHSLDASGELKPLVQTEEVHYRLGGLVLEIEGVGRTRDGKVVSDVIAMYWFDQAAGTYRSRSFGSGGLFSETTVQLAPEGKRISRSVGFGQATTSCVARIDEKGDWKELCETTVGSQPAVKSFDSTVSLQK